MIVSASPMMCIVHIQPDQARKSYYIVALDDSRPPYHYTVKTQIEKHPYWFTIELSDPSIARSNSSYIGHVFASIEPYRDDDQQSLITFRTYPYGFFFVVSVIVGVTILSVGLFKSPSAPPAPETYSGPFILSLFLMLLVYAMVSWRWLFGTRRKALNIVTDHFVSLSRYGLQEDKRKGSRLEWPVILPFDEITSEEQADERQIQAQER
jgi:hypothetical protein